MNFTTTTSGETGQICQTGLMTFQKIEITKNEKDRHRILFQTQRQQYLKHQKKDGKYICDFCEKPYSHTRDLKVHLKKKHNQSFVIIHEPTGKSFLQKRRSRNSVNSLRLEIQKLPVSEINKIILKSEAMKIPVSQVNSLQRIEYRKELSLKTNTLTKFILSIILADDKIQMEFASDYYPLQKVNLKSRHIFRFDAILLGDKKSCCIQASLLEMTYREFLFDNRWQRQIGQIVQQILKGKEELHKLGYVHRDLKSENIMIYFKPLRVIIIDFNRAQRVQASALGNERDTLGYLSKREDWRDGDTAWDIWALAAIIIESDITLIYYFSCKSERDSKQKSNNISIKIKSMEASESPHIQQQSNQSMKTIKIKLRELPHGSKLMFV